MDENNTVVRIVQLFKSLENIDDKLCAFAQCRDIFDRALKLVDERKAEELRSNGWTCVPPTK